MVPYYGDYAEDATVYIPFNTFSSNDPTASVTVTDLADADIHIHKNGHVDEIATDGASVVINFDSITGNHMITIDTSVDAAYATGAEYEVRLEGITVDAGTINAFVGSFSIERAGGVLAILKAGTTKVDVNTIKTQTVTAAAGITINPSVGAATIQPTNAQFEARSLPSADYTIVSDLGTVQTADHTAAIADIPTNAELATAVANVSVDEIQATAIADLFNTDSGTTYAAAVAGSAVKEIADNAGGSALTAGGIADAVWDELLSGHTGAGSSGEALAAAGTAGDPWTTALPGAYGAGTAGLLLGTTIPAAIADVPTVAEFEARSLVSADYTVVTDLGTVQTADHTAAIADIPTVAEFNARSLLSADYTVVSDLGTVQTADHTAAIADIPTNAELASAFTEIKGATWAAGTDTLEHIRNKQTDIETDTAEIGVAGAGLTNINLPNQTMDITGTITTVTGVTNTVSADVVSISGSTEAADKLEISAETMVTGTAATGTLSTTEMTTSLTITVNDQYNGRILIFASNTTTAALQGQATDITDTVTADGKLTFTALTTAPANGDSFIIV